jgi:hypothetical protein
MWLASDDGMISEQRVVDVEGSDQVLFWDIPEFVLGTEENHNGSLKIAGFRVEFWSCNLPNINTGMLSSDEWRLLNCCLRIYKRRQIYTSDKKTGYTFTVNFFRMCRAWSIFLSRQEEAVMKYFLV